MIILKHQLSFYLRLLLVGIFCVVNALSSFGQKGEPAPKGKKITCTANMLTHDGSINPDVQILIGNVRFEHEGAICYADTAFFNEAQNTIDAYGQNLVIHINDSVSLYGKHLQYNGHTRQAVIYHDVRLTNETAVLYSDKLHYDRVTDVAYYNTGGRIENGESVLTSQQGWF